MASHLFKQHSKMSINMPTVLIVEKCSAAMFPLLLFEDRVVATVVVVCDTSA